jgi:steroid delta-isomerase-like uncharacterized protein
MPSKNVETIQRAHRSYNTRKFKECADQFADGGVCHDLPRGEDWPKARFGEFLQGWARAFSDSQVAAARYIDAGNIVVSEFRVRGTNDGPLGRFPASHKQMDVPYCEVVHFDDEGKIDSVTAYYDVLSMMVQLGHLQKGSEQQPSAPM